MIGAIVGDIVGARVEFANHKGRERFVAGVEPEGFRHLQAVVRFAAAHEKCWDEKGEKKWYHDQYLKRGFGLITMSNYYPSAPWYPAAKMTKNYWRGGSTTTIPSW